MLDLVDRARLVEEARDRLGARDVGVQDLERHLAAEPHVLAFVDRADAAFTELANEPVVAEHVPEPQLLALLGLDDEHRAVFRTCAELGAVDAAADYT